MGPVYVAVLGLGSAQWYRRVEAAADRSVQGPDFSHRVRRRFPEINAYKMFAIGRVRVYAVVMFADLLYRLADSVEREDLGSLGYGDLKDLVVELACERARIEGRYLAAVGELASRNGGAVRRVRVA